MIYLATLTLLLDGVAMGLSIRLARFSGFRSGWALMATAIGLLAIRNGYLAATHGSGSAVSGEAWASFAFSGLCVTALLMFAPGLRQMMQSEERLRESEARLREIAETIRDGFWLMDPAMTRVLYASPAVDEIWGELTPAQRQDPATYLERIHPEDRKKVLERRATLASGREASYEYRIIRPDGSTLHVRTRGYPVKGPRGVERIIGITQDLTELREVQSQFLHSQKMEALGRLAGGVAHDFNNLLTVILGFAETARDELPRDHPIRASLDQILAASERAATLTGHLLAFSRKQTVRFVTLDLNKVVEHLQSILRRLVGEKISVVLRMQGALPPIFADRSQVEQIVMNLAVNARDAMPGGGKLTLETSSFEVPPSPPPPPGAPRPGRHVRLTVSDTGVGMDSVVRARLFEPFFTTKEPGKGTGLGLSTVYGIVTQFEGLISVHSEPGKGSTFTITLPAAADIAVRKGTSPPLALSASPSQTILTAEDEPEIRDLVGATLTRMGHRVLAAANAEEALRMADQEPGQIALLVTDSVMPGISGRELARALRSRRPGVRVLFVSGYPRDEVFDKDGPSEGEDFLPKPFTPAKLSRAVRQLLEPGHAEPDRGPTRAG